MSDRDAFLAAVIADPADDLPRLVFADHLDESGHPADAARAQFIRLQIEAARHPVHVREHTALMEAAYQLRPAFTDEADRLPTRLYEVVDQVAELSRGFRSEGVIRRRGFVDELSANSILLERVADKLFTLAPIRAVNVHYIAGPNEWLERAGYLMRVESLTFGPHPFPRPDCRDVDHQPLIRTAHLPRVRTLRITHHGLNDSWLLWFARAFAQASFAASLRVLDLSKNSLTDAGANVLLSASWSDRLEKLVLVNNRLTPDGWRPLRQRFGDRLFLWSDES